MLPAYEWSLLAAAIILILELLTGTMVFLGFALGLAAIAALQAVTGRAGTARDALVFAVVSGAAVAALRAVFGRRGDTRFHGGDINEP